MQRQPAPGRRGYRRRLRVIGLWFNDATQSWTAGQAGDCIGLIVTSWSSTQVVFALGSEYANYPPVQSGDQIEVEVQGATFSGPLA